MQDCCPECGSKDIEIKQKKGVKYIICTECEYDESMDYDQSYPDEKTSAGRGSPYKRGGAQRVVKK